jgi:hypothetical protein
MSIQWLLVLAAIVAPVVMSAGASRASSPSAPGPSLDEPAVPSCPIQCHTNAQCNSCPQESLCTDLVGGWGHCVAL